jgi:hypothetical protein
MRTRRKTSGTSIPTNGHQPPVLPYWPIIPPYPIIPPNPIPIVSKGRRMNAPRIKSRIVVVSS